jgi:hypothetical protein
VSTSGPICLALGEVESDATATRRPQQALVREGRPLGRLGARLRAAGYLASLIVLLLASYYAEWWLEQHLPPATGIVVLCLFVALIVGCIVYIEVTRRGRRGILP